jgi:hypothetical protein
MNKLALLEYRIATLEKQAFLGLDLIVEKITKWLNKLIPNKNFFQKFFRKYFPSLRSIRQIPNMLKESKKFMETRRGKDLIKVLNAETRNPIEQAKILADTAILIDSPKGKELLSQSASIKTATNPLVSITVVNAIVRNNGGGGGGGGDIDGVQVIVYALLMAIMWALGTQAAAAGATALGIIWAAVQAPLFLFGICIIGYLVTDFGEVVAWIRSKFQSDENTNKTARLKNPQDTLRQLHSRIAFLEFCSAISR